MTTGSCFVAIIVSFFFFFLMVQFLLTYSLLLLKTRRDWHVIDIEFRQSIKFTMLLSYFLLCSYCSYCSSPTKIKGLDMFTLYVYKKPCKKLCNDYVFFLLDSVLDKLIPIWIQKQY